MHGRAGRKKGTVAADQGEGRGSPQRRRSGHSRGRAALGGQRPLDPRDRRRQGSQARVAFDQERAGQRQGRRDQKCHVAARHARERELRNERARSRRRSRPSRKPPVRAPAKTKARTRNRGRTARRCRISCRRRSPPCARRRRAADGWVHEIKFDGYRIQARLDHGEVRLLTRKGLDWTEKFPNVAAAVAELPRARGADRRRGRGRGRAKGISSFSGLQAALKAGERDRFVYYVFDLLHLDGRDLTDLPLDRAQGRIGAPRRKGAARTDQIQRAFRGRGPGGAASRLPAGARRNRLEAQRTRPIAAAGRTPSSRPNARTRRNSWSAAIRRRPCCRGRSARWSSAITIDGRLDLCRPRRHRLHAGGGAGPVEAAASAGDRRAAVRSNSARRKPAAATYAGSSPRR